MQSIFGTDGIRGRMNQEITTSLAKKIGYVFGLTFNNKSPVIIGRDTRTSGGLLLEALITGINSAGKEVFDVGICPTPAIPFLIKKYKFSSGIMISASHNPPEYNGIKFFDDNGKKLKKAQEDILEKKLKDFNKIRFNNKYNINCQQRFDLLKSYEDSLIESMGDDNLKGIKIILDTCHGSATTCAENIFKRLGAEIKVINGNPDGRKINVKCGSTYLSPIQKVMDQTNADMGFSFDGDADRVIGIDSDGNILNGDHILFLWGRELMEEKKLTKNILVSSVMANLGFEKAWNDLGGILYRTPVGDKFIHERILDQNAYLGGEQSGHILSRINDYSGDGVLTAIHIAKYCKRKQINLKNWLNSSFSAFPQKLTNINLLVKENALKKEIQYFINQTIEKTIKNSAEELRILVRPSGTEPLLRILVEAKDKYLVNEYSKKITNELEAYIKNLENDL